jgi:hypothetical protein
MKSWPGTMAILSSRPKNAKAVRDLLDSVPQRNRLVVFQQK